MQEAYSTNIKNLIQAVLTSPGEIDPSVRQAIQAHLAQLSNPHNGREVELAPDTTSYVEKIALHAYKITEADIDALRERGYSEDAIFEITLSAALGAGITRLEKGLAALKGDQA